ncbi:Gluconolactonase [Planctomycetales bacterium 10988]|nr:Gluconolactonase [Planctomycetales bacterium 10988]
MKTLCLKVTKNRLILPLLFIFLSSSLFLNIGKAQPPDDAPNSYPTLGKIKFLDPALEKLVDKNAKIEVVASGFKWSEGPVWVPQKKTGYVLFSDIPRNRIMKWSAASGIEIFMEPAGYTGVVDYGAEPGTNGLMLSSDGNLTMCEHGDRRVSILFKDGGKKTLVDSYQGKRLNSPNDLIYKQNGDLYFTDPPYGLPKRFDDPRKELDFCGVYRLSTAGEVTLLTKSIERPNGIAFSPDEKTLYVAQSHPEQANWTAFPVLEDGTLGEGTLFYDATDRAGKEPGLPDGMCVDQSGNVWATGPGGVHIFTPQGTLLGKISTGERTANCTFGDDGSTLYLTADMYLCRVKTKTKGIGF